MASRAPHAGSCQDCFLHAATSGDLCAACVEVRVRIARAGLCFRRSSERRLSWADRPRTAGHVTQGAGLRSVGGARVPGAGMAWSQPLARRTAMSRPFLTSCPSCAFPDSMPLEAARRRASRRPDCTNAACVPARAALLSEMAKSWRACGVCGGEEADAWCWMSRDAHSHSPAGWMRDYAEESDDTPPAPLRISPAQDMRDVAVKRFSDDDDDDDDDVPKLGLPSLKLKAKCAIGRAYCVACKGEYSAFCIHALCERFYLWGTPGMSDERRLAVEQLWMDQLDPFRTRAGIGELVGVDCLACRHRFGRVCVERGCDWFLVWTTVPTQECRESILRWAAWLEGQWAEVASRRARMALLEAERARMALLEAERARLASWRAMIGTKGVSMQRLEAEWARELRDKQVEESRAPKLPLEEEKLHLQRPVAALEHIEQRAPGYNRLELDRPAIPVMCEDCHAHATQACRKNCSGFRVGTFGGPKSFTIEAVRAVAQGWRSKLFPAGLAIDEQEEWGMWEDNTTWVLRHCTVSAQQQKSWQQRYETSVAHALLDSISELTPEKCIALLGLHKGTAYYLAHTEGRPPVPHTRDWQERVDSAGKPAHSERRPPVPHARDWQERVDSARKLAHLERRPPVPHARDWQERVDSARKPAPSLEPANLSKQSSSSGQSNPSRQSNSSRQSSSSGQSALSELSDLLDSDQEFESCEEDFDKSQSPLNGPAGTDMNASGMSIFREVDWNPVK